MNNKIPCGGFYLDDTLSVDENGKLGVNRFVVTFTMSENRSIASDKTFAEISTAIESGLYVYGLLIAGVTTFNNIPATQVYALQMSQYVLGRGVVFIGLSVSPTAVTVLSLYMDADNNISMDELTLSSGK